LIHPMKLAVAFAVLCAASTQGFARAEETASAPNLAFIKLPGFQNDEPKAKPFTFRALTLPSAFIFQGNTPIPMEWWQQGSSSPLAVVIGNAEGTRSLDGSMTPAYYWHRDPGNGANNFGSFSFQHLSEQDTLGALDQAGSDGKRAAAAERALPQTADQRQLVKLRRFHDLLQLQAERNGLQLTNLELINGLDLATQSELAGLDAWGYVDRLAQSKETIADPEEQIIRARTWSYWDPVKNRWAAPGLGNTEYYIRRDQARRFNALKQALLYQEQRPSLLQSDDLARAATGAASASGVSPSGVSPSGVSHRSEAEDDWAIALLDQPAPLEGSRFNRQPLQLEVGHSGLTGLLAETVAAETILANALAENATVAIANPEDIRLEDVDFKGELNRAKNQVSPQLSEADAIAVATNLERPLVLEIDAEPAWDSLAMTPEEFALATAIARPDDSADVASSGLASNFADATQTQESEAIAIALEASVVSASANTASVLVNEPFGASRVGAAVETGGAGEELSAGSVSVPSSAQLSEAKDIRGDISNSLFVVQPFIPEALQAIPLEAATVAEPTAEAIKPGQPLKKHPEIAQLAAIAHVQAAEPLISDRIESKEFLDLASGLKESPIAVMDESLGLATASAGDAPTVSSSAEAELLSADATAIPPVVTQPSVVIQPATVPQTALNFAPNAGVLEQEASWPGANSQIEADIEASLVEPILPEDVQSMLAEELPVVEVEQAITETVLFFEENISQPGTAQIGSEQADLN